MGFGDKFDFYGYNSDDGTTYAIKLSEDVAAQGGFTTTVNPSTEKVWAYHAKNLRYVRGVTSDGSRAKIPIQSNTSTLYVSGGTFTLHGNTYTVEGRIGEKRKLNSVP